MMRDMSIAALRADYANGKLAPGELMAQLRERASDFADHNIWIHLLSEAQQAPHLAALSGKDPESHPLWGIPFTIKDNIDLAGIPTTAACEEFSYVPGESAFVVQRLLDAGAIPVGKANLDQFATGLNGTRSPYGPCRNAFDKNYTSGGSSSGSAVAVALGLSSFSLGTDTAGSGRVPACFNNLVGVKPSRGLLSASGMVPACRSLDCMTIFALDTDDAESVLSVAEGSDPADPYSRCNPFQNQSRQYGERTGPLRMGVIPAGQLQFFGDDAYEAAYAATLERLASDGIEFVEIDYAPFDEAARLLYEGPWVAERYIAIREVIEQRPEVIFPVVREIIAPGGEPRATDLFEAQYRLNALKQRCESQLATVDCLLTPTAGRCFTITEMLEQPVVHNSQLGYYTNFMNLLDLAAVAVPTAMADNGLPFGVTLAAPAFSDRVLLSIARRLHGKAGLKRGAGEFVSLLPQTPPVVDGASIDVLVCGAHLDGLPLNWQLRERGGVLKETTVTAPVYRMYALAGGPPYRPGLVLDEQNGAAIEVEIWSVPAGQFGSFVAGIPAPLGIGKVRVADGSQVSGFICEPWGLEGAEEITELGGWRAYLAR